MGDDLRVDDNGEVIDGEPIFLCSNPDDEDYDALDGLIDELAEAEDGSWSWADVRLRFDEISDELGEFQGIPIPLPDTELVLNRFHPMRDRLIGGTEPEPTIQIVEGGPASGGDRTLDDVVSEIKDRLDGNPPEETVRAQFYSRREQATIFIYERAGRVFHAKLRHAPDRSMERFTLALQTMGAIDAWDLDAEYRARDKLRGMISEHHWRQYELTGQFLEYSPRSRLYYVFRKNRPTIVMSARGKHNDDNMHLLTTLCMHPIGFYSRTWAGCLTPTDDVIAHLLMMRGDEAGFWGQANQHAPHSPEAGL